MPCKRAHCAPVSRLDLVHQVALKHHLCAVGQLAGGGCLWQLLNLDRLREHTHQADGGVSIQTVWGLDSMSSLSNVLFGLSCVLLWAAGCC